MSSDEDIEKRDEDSNAGSSRYSSYGQEINKIISNKKPVELEKPKTSAFSQGKLLVFFVFILIMTIRIQDI